MRAGVDLYGRLDALRRAVERERGARLDAEHAAARAAAEAGALRIEVRQLCEENERLKARVAELELESCNKATKVLGGKP